MQLTLYNTITKTKEIFEPIDRTKVRMYVCGPTVYDYPHLGNALAVVIYDVLFRLFNHLYGHENVIYVRNITDVDDKIIQASKQQNISIEELTDRITKIFQSNIKALSCLEPTFQPKATEHIAEMIEIINKLIDGGYAYTANGHVYFRVNKFSDYYRLSGRSSEGLIAGARIEIDNDKENPEDFVLWKSEDENNFPSPFGPGRPGWHIECSAMSSKYLGNDFDIHGGGIDLIFPHHTNEIAQSCCANPGSKYARFWIHNGFLTVNGEKMSKSLNNFITIEELLQKKVHGEVIRYVLLASHYRKPIDWNEKTVDDAKKALDSFYRVRKENNNDEELIDQEFLDVLADDLNTPQALAKMHEYAHQYNKSQDELSKANYAKKLNFCCKFLGFFEEDTNIWFNNTDIDIKYVENKINERNLAKLNKDWLLADKIREELSKQRIILEDKAGGITEWRSN